MRRAGFACIVGAMPVRYRPAHANDLEPADALVVGSINDLCERHGFGRIAALRPPHFVAFSLQDDPRGLWVAEEDGQLVGFAFSWICGDLWFLAQLFVSPQHQGNSIGRELLQRALAHARQGATSAGALITFAFNRVSQALYIRHGLFPRLPIYALSGGREQVATRLPVPELRCVALRDDATLLEALDRIDRRVLGVPRGKHHRFLLADGATTGTLLCKGDNPVAYAYVGPDGHVGPLAVSYPEVFDAAFAAAMHLALARGAPQVSCLMPGSSEAGLRLATGLGMRITMPLLLMSDRSFGDWPRYLPRNPGFM
jgi:ribosomal protein S18 acetylase RimI-like enzyme